MLGENWAVPAVEQEKETLLSKALGVGRPTARILISRGYDTPESARRFLNKTDLKRHDPFLLKDMDKAVARIRAAMSSGETVCVYGDYDVDGVTAATVLYLYFISKGVKCQYYIPSRATGYGLNKAFIREAAGHTDLIVTVDTGITAIEETAYAASLGIDVIITDHHNCRETLPEACAVVNPRRPDCGYPYKDLAGVGVAFKLVCALEGDGEAVFNEYVDLAAIGTVADVMPLTGENRLMVDTGLKKLSKTQREGLKALLDSAGVLEKEGARNIHTSTLGYVIAPRLNAAGRISDAGKAMKLLLETDRARAASMAEELCEINRKRQATEQKIYEEATNLIGAHRGRRHCYVLGSDRWHQGVVGVVASKISEKYSVPAILFSFDGEIGKGSGRSVKGIGLTEMLTQCADLLLEYGGHELAAGLTIKKENFKAFSERFEALSRERFKNKIPLAPVDIDCRLDFDEINVENALEILKLEPFGLSNPTPLFIVADIFIHDVIPLSGDKHIRLKVKSPRGGEKEKNAVFFGVGHREFPFCRGDFCEIACTLGVNEYRDIAETQIVIRAVRPPQNERDEIRHFLGCYSHTGEPEIQNAPLPPEMIPNLDDFRAFYRVLRREIDGERKRLSLRYLKRRIEMIEGADLNPCKMMIILDVMGEFNLAEIVKIRGNDLVEISLSKSSRKVDLEMSQTLKNLKKRGV